MERYQDLSGDSGVYAFEIGDDSITVEFKGGATYLYNYASTGREYTEKMKVLALSGDGLNSYINKYVKNMYASKLR